MTKSTPLLLAVDGNSLAHRAHHAGVASNLRHSDGRPMWAVRGVLHTLLGAAVRFRPAAIVIGFDDPTRNERAEAYPQYKDGRPSHAPEIGAQIVTLAETLAALGVAVRVLPGLEADDVLACAATEATAAGWRCVLATSDRDSFALVTDTVRVLRVGGPIADAPLLGPQAILATAGVLPETYRDLAALRGDTSDNLPGVRGIGPVTATKLLTALGSADAAFADLDTGGDRVLTAVGKAVAAKLADPAARQIVDRNRAMMRLHDDLPLNLTLAADSGPGRLPLPDPTSALTAVELSGLAERWTRTFGAAPPGPTASAPTIPAPRAVPATERTPVPAAGPAARPVLAGRRVPALPAAWPLTL